MDNLDHYALPHQQNVCGCCFFCFSFVIENMMSWTACRTPPVLIDRRFAIKYDNGVECSPYLLDPHQPESRSDIIIRGPFAKYNLDDEVCQLFCIVFAAGYVDASVIFLQCHKEQPCQCSNNTYGQLIDSWQNNLSPNDVMGVIANWCCLFMHQHTKRKLFHLFSLHA